MTSVSKKSTAIGIDLGTTYCCAALFRHNTVEVIVNGRGERLMPSYVAFDPEEKSWFVGDTAKDFWGIRHPENVVFDAKRIIGRRYQDDVVQQGRPTWPFQIIDHEGDLKIVLPGNPKDIIISPEDVSAKILEQIKREVTAELNEEVTQAVITVPASFNDSQRHATLNAANKAGLKVLCLLNEPTAAALAYGHDKDDLEGRILVFDFGGGTLDVSIVYVKDQTYTVLVTTGNDTLGGEDIVNNLVRYVSERCRKKANIEIEKNNRKLCRVRRACEALKKNITFCDTDTLFIENIADGYDFELELNRCKFEEINHDIFVKAMKTVEKAIQIASIVKEDISKVVMVGGSSKIPKLSYMLSTFFGYNIPILNNMPADEAIAKGAAIMASVLNGTYQEERKNIILVDVIPRSLGIELYGGKMSILLPRCVEIPCERTDKYETMKDNQSCIDLPIYEGEEDHVSKNYYLGTVSIHVPPAPKGTSKIDVTFKIDSCGVLTVTARDLTSGNSTNIAIDRHLQRI